MVSKFPIEQILDAIYEAAFDPDRWLVVLRYLTVASESASTGIGILDERQGMGLMDEYNTRQPDEGFWLKSDMERRNFIEYARRHAPLDFTNRESYFPKDYPNLAEINERLRSKNIADQLGATINLPTGQVVSITSERWLRDGVYPDALGARLDMFRPHLARAALLSANMGMQRATGTMAALNALGLPAAMLSLTGKVLETNELMAQTSENVRPVAWGMLRLTQAGADKELQQIIAEMRAGLAPRAKTIPVTSGEDRQLVHVIPISGATRNLFYEARLLLVITKVGAASIVPSREILMRLYQLTEAEVRLARVLAAGQSLQDCALFLGVSYGTARSYLLRIFRKTETNQQSELVAVLKSIAQIGVVPR